MKKGIKNEKEIETADDNWEKHVNFQRLWTASRLWMNLGSGGCDGRL